MLFHEVIDIFNLLEGTKSTLKNVVIWEPNSNQGGCMNCLLLQPVKLLLPLVPKLHILLILREELQSICILDGFFKLLFVYFKLLESFSFLDFEVH